MTNMKYSARLVALLLVLAAVVLVAVVAFSFRPDYLGTLLSNPHLAGLSVMSWLLWFTAVGVILALLMHMKDVFTAPLELRVDAFDAQGNPISEDDLEAIRRVMRFGYSAMTLALVLSILLFMVPLFWTGSEHAFTQSPIGVLKGCRSSPDQIGSTSISEVDDPLSCEIHGPQWLLNIGGTVAPLYELLGQETRLTTEFQALVEDATALLKNLIDQLADGLEADGAGGGAVDPLLSLRQAANELRYRGDAGMALEALETWMDEAAKQGLPSGQAQRVHDDLVKLHKHMNQLGSIGCIVDAGGSAGCGFAVKGGLVLPLYVIVFSLFGGAISMTRRLPEYQRRVTQAYWKSYASEQQWYPNLKPPISPESLREFVIFQIMQTLSAPLIAATAYALLEPSNQATGVVIGFAAGFASEPILLQLRKLADQLSGSIEMSPAKPPAADRDTPVPTAQPASRVAGRPEIRSGAASDRLSRGERRRTVRATKRLARVRRERAAEQEVSGSAKPRVDDATTAADAAEELAVGADPGRRPGGHPGGRRERVRKLLEGARNRSRESRDEDMP
jgi:hypothetical protein